MNYLKAKLKLFMTHIIAPNYTHWDLEIVFADKEWTVKVVGWLYPKEFEDMNKRLANGELSEKELACEVRKYPSLLPMTAVSQSAETGELS